MNAKALLAIATLHGDSRKDLAQALAIDPSSLSAKMHNYRGRSFNLSEVGIIVNRYKLPIDTVCSIFLEDL